MNPDLATSAELEKAFEDEVTGEVPDSTEVNGQLNTAVTALTELNTLHQGIKAEGVSQEDVQSVFTVIQRLNDAGLECGIAPALEEYDLGHYTKTRSMVNQQVSVESIGATIINVIKLAIEKLIAFVAAIYKSYRVAMARDRTVQATFDSARNKSKDVQEVITQLKRLNLVAAPEIEEAVITFAKEQLASNKKIPRSSVGLAALMHKEEQQWIKRLHQDAERHTRLLRIAVKGVNQVVGQGVSAVSIDLELFKNLDGLRGLIDQAKTEHPEEDFITKQVDYQVLIDATMREQMAPLVKHEYLMKAFYDIAGDLRALKRFKPDGSDPEFANTLVELLNYLTKGFEDLDLIVRFFVYLKDVQLQVCRIQLQILNRHASMLFQHVQQTAVHEASRRKAEESFDRLAKKLRTYGI